MARSERTGQFNGAMDEVSQKVQEVSTHRSGIGVDLAIGECDTGA